MGIFAGPKLPLIQAVGGTVTEIVVGNLMYKVHSFTQVGINTFTISSVIANPSFQYLIVAGGGNGGHSDGSVQAQRMSGGGAGGVVMGTATFEVGSKTISVGAGGYVE